MSDVSAIFTLEFTDLPSKLKLLNYNTFVSAVFLSIVTTGVEMRSSTVDAMAVYDQDKLVYCESFVPVQNCPSNSEIQHLEECKEYMYHRNSICKADQALPDGDPIFEINNCGSYDIFRCVFLEENPLAIKLVSNIGHNGHFIGNGEYSLIDSSSPTYHNKVNKCSLTKMNGIDSCGSDTCEKTCSDALCYEGNCPNNDFEHVVPPTIFTNCSQGGPQTCSTAEYALYELDPENGLSVVSTDEFEIDEVKIQKNTEMKVSHLPIQYHFSHMTRPTLVLIVLVSLLLLILVIDVIWCNWTNQGIEKIKSTIIHTVCSGNSEPEKQCVDMKILKDRQEKHDKKFEDIRTLTKQTGQKQIAPMFRQRSRSWSSSENFQKPEDMQPLLKNRNNKHR